VSILRKLLPGSSGGAETRAIQRFDVFGDDTGYDSPVNGTMSNDKALRLGAVFACVRIIAEDAASLPLESFRREAGEDKLQRTPEWVAEPNPEMTTFDLVEQTFASLELDGNAYAAAVRDQRGYVVEMWPLDHRNVHPRRRLGSTGPVVYDVADPATGLYGTFDRAGLLAGEIVHVKAFGYSGAVRGLSPLERARLQIGTGLALDEFAARFFSQGSNQSGYLQTDQELTQEQADRLVELWIAKNSGLQNSHKPAVAAGGLKWEATSITNEQAQFLESRRYGVLEIARIFRVPPHKLAELSRATFSNIEQQSIEYVTGSLTPRLTRVEQTWSRLLPRDQFFRFDVDGLLRGDMMARAQAAMLWRGAGVKSQNELRRTEKLPSIGAEGDSLLVPLNMAPNGPGAPKLVADPAVTAPAPEEEP
jgi:HK97 family phage portal protein